MADLQEIIEIRELPTKDSPSDSDYLVVDDETLTNRVKYSNFKSSMTKEVEEKINETLQENIDSLRSDVNKCKKVFEYLNPTDTTYLIGHDLSTKDFLINVYSINGKDLNPTIERLDDNSVQLTFEEVPSDFRVVIFAIND